MARILFVFEGERTEAQISVSIKRLFFESSVIECAYCNDLYELHKEILADQDLDTFSLVKNLSKENRNKLSGYTRNDFAEIYLFFDYDGHDTIAEDNKVIEVLNFFNEETSSGKLYLSYPMVEALKHYSCDIEFDKLKVLAKCNINYKQLVDNEAENNLKQFNKYTAEIWHQLIHLHLNKNEFCCKRSLFPARWKHTSN